VQEADRAAHGWALPASANPQLKTRHILRKLRCCSWRAGQLVKAIHVLQTAKSEDEKGSLVRKSAGPEGALLARDGGGGGGPATPVFSRAPG
jgi:hypothetical protein